MAELPAITGLNAKQQAFVDEYVRNGGNASAAYAKAYGTQPNTGTTRAAASRLMRHVNVRAAVSDALRRELGSVAVNGEPLDISPGRIALELARVGYSDVRRLFNEDGTPKKPSEWDEATARAVSMVEVSYGTDGRVTTRTKLWNKVPALEALTALQERGKAGQRNVSININLDPTPGSGDMISPRRREITKGVVIDVGPEAPRRGPDQPLER
jgi:phage terminase small subunit